MPRLSSPSPGGKQEQQLPEQLIAAVNEPVQRGDSPAAALLSVSLPSPFKAVSASPGAAGSPGDEDGEVKDKARSHFIVSMLQQPQAGTTGKGKRGKPQNRNSFCLESLPLRAAGTASLFLWFFIVLQTHSGLI